MEQGSEYDDLVNDPSFFPDWSTTVIPRHVRHVESTQQDPEPLPMYPASPNPSTRESDGTLLFFYGTLSIPHILQQILDLPDSEVPILQPAKIYGYTIKMWGPYPTLVPTQRAQLGSKSRKGSNLSNQAFVNGMAYWGRKDDIPRLSRYEGSTYKLVDVTVFMDDKEVVGQTYAWHGSPNDPELVDGTFDPSMFPNPRGTTLG